MFWSAWLNPPCYNISLGVYLYSVLEDKKSEIASVMGTKEPYSMICIVIVVFFSDLTCNGWYFRFHNCVEIIVRPSLNNPICSKGIITLYLKFQMPVYYADIMPNEVRLKWYDFHKIVIIIMEHRTVRVMTQLSLRKRVYEKRVYFETKWTDILKWISYWHRALDKQSSYFYSIVYCSCLHMKILPLR